MGKYKNYTSFIEAYNQSLNIRRMVKGELFVIEDGSNLKVKITHIHPDNNYNGTVVNVNIKVSGTIQNYWKNPLDVTGGNFHSSIDRNKKIRYKVNNEIKNYLKLFGLKTWQIEIKKVKVCTEL